MHNTLYIIHCTSEILHSTFYIYIIQYYTIYILNEPFFSWSIFIYSYIYTVYIYIYIYYTYNWIITSPLKKNQVVPPGFRGRPSWAPRTHVTGSSSGRNRAPRFGVPGACHRNRFRSNDFTMDHDGSWWIRDSCRIFRTQDGGFCWSWSEIGNYFLELLY